MRILKSKYLVLCVCTILFIIPFFWLKPGEMDLGGDSSRLYFYDPISYLKSAGLYVVSPEGLGQLQPNYYFIPFVGMLAIIKQLVSSPYILISLFNSVKLILSFLFIYLIVKEMLVNIKIKQKIAERTTEISSIFAGLLYIFMPTMTINWDKVLITHNQVFLNPMIFYLLMKYVSTKNLKYLWFILLSTVIFAPNFSWVGTPSFFSFFPLAILFLFLYTKIIRRIAFPWKGTIIGSTFFLGLHTFHLYPQVINLFDPGSFINTRVFDKESALNEGVRYFLSILPLSKVSLKILIPSTVGALSFFSLLVPFVVVTGFIFNKKNKEILLVSIFFLITLFLLTANITNLGVVLYKYLFYIPGFSIFRNFIGQWLFVYSFFYSILFGISLFIIFPRLKNISFILLSLILSIVLIAQAWPFINGDIINHKHFRSDKNIAIKIDPGYEGLLIYVKHLPDDSKILSLPFSDFYVQVIAGGNNGAYVGPSTISYLTDKKNFTGYTNMDSFADVFFRLSKNKDYKSINSLLGLLNIRYVFHNSDPNVYDKAFQNYPYEYARKFMPVDQKEYVGYVNEITSGKIYENGPYKLFEVNRESYLPHIYVSKNLITYKDAINDWKGKNMSFFVGKKLDDPRIAYIEEKYIDKYLEAYKDELSNDAKSIPQIAFTKINPTKYRVSVLNANTPYLLVLSETFNSSWKIFLSNKESSPTSTIASYFNGEIKEGQHQNSLFNTNIFKTFGQKSLPEDNHILVNGYANAWYISPKDMDNKEDYEITIEMVQQRSFYLGGAISILFFVGFIIWGMKLFLLDRLFGTISKHHD